MGHLRLRDAGFLSSKDVLRQEEQRQQCACSQQGVLQGGVSGLTFIKERK